MKDANQTEYEHQIIKVAPILNASLHAQIRNHHDAQDILQNTLLSLSRKKDKFDPKKGSFKTFTFMLCKREIANFFRKSRQSHLVFMNDVPEYGSYCDRLELYHTEMEEIFKLLSEEKRAFLLRYHFGTIEKTSTERNRAMRILREVAAKLALLDPEAFSG